MGRPQSTRRSRSPRSSSTRRRRRREGCEPSHRRAFHRGSRRARRRGARDVDARDRRTTRAASKRSSPAGRSSRRACRRGPASRDLHGRRTLLRCRPSSAEPFPPELPARPRAASGRCEAIASRDAGRRRPRRQGSRGPTPGRAAPGRGQAAARLAGSSLSARSRRVIVKARLVVLRTAGPRAVEIHLRYIVREGVTRDGQPVPDPGRPGHPRNPRNAPNCPASGSPLSSPTSAGSPT